METFTRKNSYNFNRSGYPRPQKSFFSKHFHDYYELLLFKTGNITFVVENLKYVPKENDLFLLPPNTYHFVNVLNDKIPYDRYVLQFDKTPLNEELLPVIFKGPRCVNLSAFPDILDWFKRFLQYVETYPDEQLDKIDEQLIYELLMLLSNQLSHTEEHHAIPTESNALVTKILEYIDDNFITINSVDDIANALYVSKTHLFYCFKKYLEISPLRYVQTKKLLYARQLIKEGVRPTEAGVKCGIPEYTTFFRLYKKQFGHPPSKNK